MSAAAASASSAASLFSLVGTQKGANLSTWCPTNQQLLQRHLQHEFTHTHHGSGPRLVIDVGSFDGSDALFYARESRRVVWTFEPSPTKHEPIRKRLREAGVASVTLFPYALSNRSAEGRLEMRRAERAAGRAFVHNKLGSAQDALAQADNPSAPPANGSGFVSVPIRMLDEVVEQHAGPNATIAWMKVDAQGFDTLVLRGAARLLAARRIEHFAFEFAPTLMPSRESEAVDALRWLAGLGYDCVPCNQRHTIPRVNASLRIVRAPPRSYEEFVLPFVAKSSTTLYDDVACGRRELGRADVRSAWRVA